MLEEGWNEVVVFELEPESVAYTMTAIAEKERRWGNAVDLDYLGCV